MLGMEVTRNKEKRLIMVTMRKRIEELCSEHPEAIASKRNVPMPTYGYIVREDAYESLPEKKRVFLSRQGIEVYMAVVGSLIWIQGVRMDIIFTVLYLSWHTKAPRQHHLDMAYYCIGYLHTTIDYPLVLGGPYPVRVVGYSDASLATGPKSRSITATIMRLNELSGAICAKASATQNVPLSSCEAEFYGCADMVKNAERVSNELRDMGIEPEQRSELHSDNLAMINVVKGEAGVKGLRHMEMRMWFVRDEYSKGKFELKHMSGKVIPTDKLTKLGNVVEHRIFVRDILGHNLVGPEFMSDVGD
jgi:hypothetical protein